MINLIGLVSADLILAQVRTRPDFGEEHMVDDMIMRPGAAANLVFPLARLGVKPRLISVLGRDRFGEDIYREITPLVDNDIYRSERDTCLSVSVVRNDGARYFVTYAGSALEFTEDIVRRSSGFERARATMFYGYFLLPAFGAESVVSCLQRAKAAGQITFFDANSATDGWSERSRNDIFSFLPYIDYFMPNEEEVLHLTGRNTVEDAVSLLVDKGANTVVVKRGAGGASAFTATSAVHHPGFKVAAYDTTGAGDSFDAGFMFSLLQDGEIGRALAFGNALASIVVSRRENRYPSMDEVLERLKTAVG
jgi:sugar/nucleoside kinase (ribokinase family)